MLAAYVGGRAADIDEIHVLVVRAFLGVVASGSVLYELAHVMCAALVEFTLAHEGCADDTVGVGCPVRVFQE